MRAPATLGLLMILLGAVSVQSIGLFTVSAYETDFYFHNYEELSITIQGFQIGNSQVPTTSTGSGSPDARCFGYTTSDSPTSAGVTVALSSQIPVLGSPSGYAAVAAWLTNPFPLSVTLDGDVIMHVWMSSSDSLSLYQGSLYFMGIADYAPSTSSTTVLWVYSSPQSLGNTLSPTPQEYTAQLHISSHEFQAGNMLMFFAGAASNKQGWEFNVYFDSPSWNSHATIPADPTLSIPEFTDSIALLVTMIIVLTTCVILARSRLRT